MAEQSTEKARRVQDRNGDLVETNAPRRDHDCIEVVMAYPEFIQAFEEWLSSRNLHLFPIPVDGDNLPCYGVGVVNFGQLLRPASMPWPEDGCDHKRATCEEVGCPNAEVVTRPEGSAS